CYPPARDWVMAQALKATDASARSAARKAYASEPAVRAQLELDLALQPTEENRSAIKQAVYAASDEPWAARSIAAHASSPDKETRLAAFRASLRLCELPQVLVDRGDSDLQSIEPEPSLRRIYLENLSDAPLSKEDQ